MPFLPAASCLEPEDRILCHGEAVKHDDGCLNDDCWWLVAASLNAVTVIVSGYSLSP